MILIEDLDTMEQPFTKAVVTIGNFDGVHKGHQALFHQVIKGAQKLGGTSVVITFDPHPLRVLGHDGPPLITRKDQKVELIEDSGVDVLIILPFTKAFADISPDRFIHDILIKQIGMAAIVVGPDYSFGKNRGGNIFSLKKAGVDQNFEVIAPNWIHDTDMGAKRISSTRIRDLVMDGHVDKIPELLGRPYQIRGKVVQGRARGGSQLGFPTANIKLHDELCPKMGVYAVTVETSHGIFKGVANIGYSPTFEDHIFTIEVHILDFSDDLYNTRIRVNLAQRLRDEKKFANIAELSNQIKQDINTARDILN